MSHLRKTLVGRYPHRKMGLVLAGVSASLYKKRKKLQDEADCPPMLQRFWFQRKIHPKPKDVSESSQQNLRQHSFVANQEEAVSKRRNEQHLDLFRSCV